MTKRRFRYGPAPKLKKGGPDEKPGPRQPLDVGRTHRGVAVGPGVAPAEIVTDEDDDVGAAGWVALGGELRGDAEQEGQQKYRQECQQSED